MTAGADEAEGSATVMGRGLRGAGDTAPSRPRPVELSARFFDALGYAAEAHLGQFRHGRSARVPYIAHLLAVCALVLENGADEDTAVAALLHDAPEDQGGQGRLDDIRARFGDRVADLVRGCTDTLDVPRAAWREVKTRFLPTLALADPAVRLIMSADKVHNAHAVLADLRALGPSAWKGVRGREARLWYLDTALAALRAGGATPLLDELERTIESIRAYPER